MNYQFWIQQGTFQKHEAVSSGKKKHRVSHGTQLFQMFRETVKQMFREAVKPMFRETVKQMFRETVKQMFRETVKQMFRETVKQMFRETVKHCNHQITTNSPVELQDLWYTGSMIHDCHIIHS
jgi:translation initiation factor RLI1